MVYHFRFFATLVWLSSLTGALPEAGSLLLIPPLQLPISTVGNQKLRPSRQVWSLTY